jgi:hypothetical protein
MNYRKSTDDPEENGTGLTEAANEREEVLRGFKDIQVMTRSLMQLEAKRLNRRLGKDHPRTREIKARLNRQLDIINKLEVGRQISKIVPPKAGEGKVLIHGRVTDHKLRGVSNLSVKFTDGKGTPYSETITSASDDSGYYSFVLDDNTVGELQRVGRGKVYVTVTDAEGKLIYRNPEPVAFVTGKTISRDLILSKVYLPGHLPDVKPPTRKKPKPPRRPGEKDAIKLEKIAGIGTARATKLRKAGIRDMKAFLNATDKKLTEILGNLNIAKMKADCRSKLRKDT